MPMWVKICANTNVEDALLAAELGADAVGFVFAPSKRRVTVEQVAEITRRVPAGVDRVGVFTTTDAEEILLAAREANLTVVQLHSTFDPRLVESMDDGLKVLQVVDVPEGMSAQELRETLKTVLAHPRVFAALLDASHGGTSGGTGKTFDWDEMAGVVKAAQKETGGKIIVAGGLRAENVGAAIAEFSPWGVDVASGVEATAGKKDPQRLRDFIEAARKA
jgi:phosphoribosylanthranilate isomerase